MDELSEACQNMHLKEEEQREIEIEVVNDEELRCCGMKSLMWKIFAAQKVSLEVLRSIIIKIWRVGDMPIFKGIRDNTFTISFSTVKDRDRVYSSHPWLFDNNLFVIKPVDVNVLLENMASTRRGFGFNFITSLWLV